MTSLHPPILLMGDILQRRHNDEDGENSENLNEAGVDDGVDGEDEAGGERVEGEEEEGVDWDSEGLRMTKKKM